MDASWIAATVAKITIDCCNVLSNDAGKTLMVVLGIDAQPLLDFLSLLEPRYGQAS